MYFNKKNTTHVKICIKFIEILFIDYVSIYFCEMKIAVRVVIFVFFFFLSTPTIVSLIEKATDTSCFYSMTEEEVSQKEIKSEFIVDYSYPEINFFVQKKSKIHSSNDLRYESISSKIFITPPEKI